MESDIKIEKEICTYCGYPLVFVQRCTACGGIGKVVKSTGEVVECDKCDGWGNERWCPGCGADLNRRKAGDENHKEEK